MTNLNPTTLRELVEGATPGPWSQSLGYNCGDPPDYLQHGSIVGGREEWFIATIENAPEAEANAALIAYLGTHAREIVEALERLAQYEAEAAARKNPGEHWSTGLKRDLDAAMKEPK